MATRSPARLRLLLAVCAWALAMPAAAQPDEGLYTPEPAHLAYLDGEATLTRDGRAEAATVNLPLVAGDQLRTSNGRAEIVYGDGSVLDVDRFTAVDFLSDDLVRMLQGAVRITVGGRGAVSYRVDTPSGAVRIDAPGEYRIALIGESSRRPDVELVTIRGAATLLNDLGETTVRAGERAFATAGLAPSYAQAYNSAAWDAFDRWAADRQAERTGTTSAQYLPEDVDGYAGAFDRYGDWRYDVSFGYVWYPRVYAGWRPYYHGRWNYYRPWGWTWIAYDPWWGWPTHHYGRWGFRAGAWFWIPRRHWAPAYVYWASAPGYVGWCPLGWNGSPVLNIVNVNVGFGRHGYDPYSAWTVVPRHAFASHVEVSRHAVSRAAIQRAVPRWSVSSAVAPVRGTQAVPRSQTPIYSAGRARAVRRGAGVATTTAPSYGAPAYRAPAREYRRTPPSAPAAQRAVPPSGAGALVSPGATVSRGADRARARYRDMGPGGPEPRYQRPEARSQSPGQMPDARSRSPRSQVPTYQVPRYRMPGTRYESDGSDRRPRAYEPRAGYGPPRGGDTRSAPPVYRGVPSRSPEYSRPSAGSAEPRPGRAAPRYGPAPSPGASRSPSARPAPSRGAPPSRAVPRGGSSSDRPSGHSRKPRG